MKAPWTRTDGEARLQTGLRRALRPLQHAAATDSDLLHLLAPARLALLGEASHGTHDFYFERAELTKRLIADHGYTAVVAEGRLARCLG